MVADLHGINPKNVVSIFIDASHIELGESAMQPRIVLHYASNLNVTDIHLVSVFEGDYRIDQVRMNDMNVADAAEYYYNLSKNTQEYYEQMIRS